MSLWLQRKNSNLKGKKQLCHIYQTYFNCIYRNSHELTQFHAKDLLAPIFVNGNGIPGPQGDWIKGLKNFQDPLFPLLALGSLHATTVFSQSVFFH